MTTLSAPSTTHTPIPVTRGQIDETRSTTRWPRYASAYAQGFMLALLLAWSPSNLLAYGAPLLMLGWFLVRTRSKAVTRNLLLLALAWFLFTLLHLPFVGDFAWAAALITVVTYSAFIPILVIPTRFLLDGQLFRRMERWIVIFVMVEASLGITQAIYTYRQSGTFDSANGDAVEGTIHPWLAVEHGSFSNPMFAANMTVLLLALLPALLTRRKYILASGLGLVSLVLASVIHILLFLAVACVIVGILYATIFLRRLSSWLLILMAIVGALLVLTLLSANLGTLRGFYASTMQARTPRAVVVVRVFKYMPDDYPLMPLLGLGPGQFSSRAAIIVTGQYFGSITDPIALPLVPIQMSEPMARYFWPEFAYARSLSYYGSTIQPAFSWLTSYTEMGGIVCLLVILFIGVLLLHIRRRAYSYALKVHAMSLSIGILFILFLGIQENYWEVPQAIFPGLLILKAMYAQFILDSSNRPQKVRHFVGQN